MMPHGTLKAWALAALLVTGLCINLGLPAPTADGQERLETEGILESLERLDRSVAEQQLALETAQAELLTLEGQRVQLLQEQAALLEAMEARRRILGRRIRALYKYSGRGFMQAVLGGADPSQGGASGATMGAFKRTRYLYYVVRHDMALLDVQKEDLARSKDLSLALGEKEVALREAAALAESETLALEDERRRRLALLDAVRRESALQDRVRRERQAANERLGDTVASLPQRQKRNPRPRAVRPTPAPTGRPIAPLAATPTQKHSPGALAPSPQPTSPPTKATIAPSQLPKEPAPQAPPPRTATPTPRMAKVPATPKPQGVPTPTPTAKRRDPRAAPTPRAKGHTPGAVPQATPPAQAVAQLPPAKTPIPAPLSPFEARRGRHIYPTTGKITRAYGRYKVEGMKAPAFSKGLEIVAPTGTPFKAVAGGQVQMADWFKGYGLMVIINHGDDYRSIYTHASRLLVKVGDQVDAGDVIGLVGDTGSLKGPYLYLELRQGKTPLNPMMWLKIPPGSVDLK